MTFHKTVLSALAMAMLAAGSTSAQQTSTPEVSIEQYSEKLKVLAETELLSWIQDPIIINSIEESNKMNAGMTPAIIDAQDKEWRRQTKIEEKYMIYDLLDRQASIILRDRRETSNGVINEIIVMDQFGMNAAISDPTSDFYQGDEAKHSETYVKGPGAVFVDEVEFDESTQKYQTQVSMTVVDPADSTKAIGAVTFGIDLSALPALTN